MLDAELILVSHRYVFLDYNVYGDLHAYSRIPFYLLGCKLHIMIAMYSPIGARGANQAVHRPNEHLSISVALK